MAMEDFFAKHLGGQTSSKKPKDIAAHLNTLKVDVNSL